MHPKLRSTLHGFRKHLPQRFSAGLHRWPSLWHARREAVARGVAFGLFTGVIPLPAQILLAMPLCIAFRGNLLAAAGATLLTNPLTAAPIWWVAYQIGNFLLPSTPPASLVEIPLHALLSEEALPRILAFLKGLGSSMIVGLLVEGVLLGAIGYASVHLSWRAVVTWRWRRRKAARARARYT